MRQLGIRKPHPEDGRSVLVQLSAHGKLLDRETEGTVEVCVRRTLAALPRSKVDALPKPLSRALPERLDALALGAKGGR
jgi:hypothetical protein